MKLSLTTENISYLLTATVVVTGAYMVLDENMEIGTLVAFVGYQATLITVIQSLTNVYGQFTTTRVAFDQLFTVLDTHSDIKECERPVRFRRRSAAGLSCATSISVTSRIS